MSVVGSGEFTYEVIEPWPTLPKYWSFDSAVGVAVNSIDEVHVLSLGKHPLTIWDSAGNFVSSWGEGAYSANPHGIHIGPNDHVWTVDRDYHVVTEHTPGGEAVRTLGNKLLPSPTAFGEPFNMPSGLAIAPSGDIFVSDGYGGNRVHRFSPDGDVILSWGRPGTGPGEFVLLHNTAVDGNGRVYICDRMNDRVQLFDDQGVFLEQWADFKQPCDVCILDDIVCVAEQGEGSSVSIWTLDHELLARWRGNEGPGKGTLTAAHGICVDSEGSIYVAQVRGDQLVRKFQRI